MSRHDWQVAVLILGVLAVPAQAQVELQWNLKEGDKFYLETTGITKQTMKVIKVLDAPIQQEFESTSVDTYTVVKKSADEIILEKKVELMKVKASGQGAEKAVQMYQRVKGAIFTLTLDSRTNTVTKVQGVSEFIKKAFADDPIMEVTMSATLNDDSVRQEQQNVLIGFLSDKPVTQGDKWTRKSRIPLGPLGGFFAEGEFTYLGKSTLNNHAFDRIDATWILRYGAPKQGRPRSGLPIAIIKGEFKDLTAKGTYYFDAASGRLLQLERKYQIKGTLTVSAMPPTPRQDMNMEIEIDQASKIRLLDKPPAFEEAEQPATKKPGTR